MKKIKLLVLLLLTSLFMSANAFSQTIGVVNYKEVLMNYNYAKETFKTLDSKDSEMQQYMLDSERKYKSLTNPVEKKNFEDKIQREYKAKVDAINKMKVQKEEEIYKNIMTVVKRIATQKKLDVIVESSVILTGGTDITKDVITGLNGK